MAKLKFPIRARALVGLTIQPATEEITGFRNDGTPIIKKQRRDTKSGEIFLIEDERCYRLLMLGDAQYAELIDEHENEIPIGEDGFPLDRSGSDRDGVGADA